MSSTEMIKFALCRDEFWRSSEEHCADIIQNLNRKKRFRNTELDFWLMLRAASNLMSRVDSALARLISNFRVRNRVSRYY